jgi:hypothetical protein
MEYTFWIVMLRPGEGWVLQRWVKKGTLWPVLVREYERLVRDELRDVIDADTSDVLLEALRGTADPTSSEQ